MRLLKGGFRGMHTERGTVCWSYFLGKISDNIKGDGEAIYKKKSREEPTRVSNEEHYCN